MKNKENTIKNHNDNKNKKSKNFNIIMKLENCIKKINHYSRNEFIFNIISFCLIISLAVYIGYKTLYYHNKEISNDKEVVNTLAKVILRDNRVTEKENGLYKDEDGYIFRGTVYNNYVKFSGRLFRIIKVNNDNTIKVASLDSQAVLAYGDNSDYKTSNIYNWLNKTNKEHSGIYQDTIPAVEEFLVKTPWCKDELINNSIECSSEKGEDYFTLLTLEDYVETLGKNSYLNIKKNLWLLGRNTDGSNLYVTNSGTVVATDNYEAYGTVVVFTLRKDIKITGGKGTLKDPYIINQGTNLNNINKFVKLGNDIWRVYKEDEGSLNLVLNTYLKDEDGDNLLIKYSKENDSFNPLQRNNIAYYLNTTYYNSLSYKDILGECTFYTGEISFSNGLDYENMYSNSISSKVGLLNSYDLNLNTELTNYFLMDTTSAVGSMATVYKNDNSLEDVKVSEEKKIVPTICLAKYLIVGGKGSIENPFVVE